VLGNKHHQPNQDIWVRKDNRIAKVRACFWKWEDMFKNTRFVLTQFELIDADGSVRYIAGKNEKGMSNWFEATIPS